MSTSSVLIFLGGVILVGVFSNFFFKKTRVPSPVVLILFGVIFGPLTGAVNASDIRFMAPYVGSIALILILFEGGLEIDPRHAFNQARTALLLAMGTFFLTALAGFACAKLILGVGDRVALLYGLVLGGVSPAIILPTLQSLNISKEVKALFALESVISEVMTVALSVLALNLFTDTDANSDIAVQALYIIHIIFISLLIAIVFGWAWNWIMPEIEKAGLSHMLTLACLFLLYAVSHWAHGEPAITILLFGLLIENGHELSLRLQKFLPKKLVHFIDFPEIKDKKIFSAIFSELTFLIRSFFFVLIGLIIDFSAMTSLLISVALSFVILAYASRKLIIRLMSRFTNKLNAISKTLGSALIPRGLATAVVAMMIAERIPEASLIVPIAFVIIIGSNLIMTVQVLYRWKQLNDESTQ